MVGWPATAGPQALTTSWVPLSLAGATHLQHAAVQNSGASMHVAAAAGRHDPGMHCCAPQPRSSRLCSTHSNTITGMRASRCNKQELRARASTLECQLMVLKTPLSPHFPPASQPSPCASGWCKSLLAHLFCSPSARRWRAGSACMQKGG